MCLHVFTRERFTSIDSPQGYFFKQVLHFQENRCTIILHPFEIRNTATFWHFSPCVGCSEGLNASIFFFKQYTRCYYKIVGGRSCLLSSQIYSGRQTTPFGLYVDAPAEVTQEEGHIDYRSFLFCFVFTTKKSSIPALQLCIFLKKNLNAPRPSEHPPVWGKKCQNV